MDDLWFVHCFIACLPVTLQDSSLHHFQSQSLHSVTWHFGHCNHSCYLLYASAMCDVIQQCWAGVRDDHWLGEGRGLSSGCGDHKPATEPQLECCVCRRGLAASGQSLGNTLPAVWEQRGREPGVWVRWLLLPDRPRAACLHSPPTGLRMAAAQSSAERQPVWRLPTGQVVLLHQQDASSAKPKPWCRVCQKR